MRHVWLRLGVTVTGTDKEIQSVLDGNEATLRDLIERGSFELDGESYIPCQDEEDGLDEEVIFDM